MSRAHLGEQFDELIVPPPNGQRRDLTGRNGATSPVAPFRCPSG
ncbi:MAG: hypothetical protein ACXWWU_05650 [Candidatus Limnocylindria bacterium]